MHFQYIPYIWLLLASAAVAAALGIYAWRHRTVPGATPFAVLMLVVVVWSLANALEMAGTDLPTKIFWANVQYLCYGAIPVAWLALALQYTGRGGWLTRSRLAWLAIEPLITVLLVWTNDLHGLMRRNVHLDTAGPFPVIGKTFGPWFWVHAAYTYLLLLVIIYLYVETLPRVPLFYRKQILVLLISFLLPLAWNLLYNFGLSPVPRHDLAPAMLSLAGVGVAWTLFRYRLFDLVPVARATVIESMADGVIVLDAQNRIVDLNPAAQETLGWTASQAVGQQAAQVFSAWPDLIALCRNATVTQTESVLGTGDAQRYYDLHSSPLSDRRGRPIGRVIALRDVTERKHAQIQLLQQQRALAALEERERLGRELHDSLGQVLGYVNVQVQAARELFSSGQAATADATLSRLAKVAQEAHADVREYILGMKTSVSPEWGFFPALEQYLQRFSQNYGIQIALSLPDDRAECPFMPAVEVQLLRIIQEALTNVRKHAGARSVQVLFTFSADQAQVLIEDDGCGFDPARLTTSDGQHFGARIMRERAEEVGGTLEVRSAPGQGTKVIVQIPLREPEAEGHLPPMRVLLVDDHPLFLEGLRNMLAARGVQVVGTASDGLEALDKARALRPDVILMDVQMPRCNGLEATRLIKAELPEVKIVMLTVSEEDEHLFEAVKSGASGYLLKSLDAKAFFEFLSGLQRGQVPFPPGLAARILEEFSRQDERGAAVPAVETQAVPGLTPRQIKVLTLVAQGLTYKEVGVALSLSEHTVKYHMGQISERLHLKNRAQVIAYAARMGLVKSEA